MEKTDMLGQEKPTLNKCFLRSKTVERALFTWSVNSRTFLVKSLYICFHREPQGSVLGPGMLCHTCNSHTFPAKYLHI